MLSLDVYVEHKDILVGQGVHLSDKGTIVGQRDILSDKGTFVGQGDIFVGQGDIFCRTRGHLVKTSLWPQQASGARYEFGNTSKT